MPERHNPAERALACLDALALGDGFGEKFFGREAWNGWDLRQAPLSPWDFTDDTVMAVAIVNVLRAKGCIDQDALAREFVRLFARDMMRGYGAGARRLLVQIGNGKPWREASLELFSGVGSWGNGGAMRAAPIGAWFADDLERAAAEAALSAEVTHGHVEGQAGAVAVAVAAAWNATAPADAPPLDMLAEAIRLVPGTEVREGLRRALVLPFSRPAETAARMLGNGSGLTAMDTVPFCLWMAARHRHDIVEALWETVSVEGDMDTNCAVVAGIVGAGPAALPSEWLARRESFDGLLRPTP